MSNIQAGYLRVHTKLGTAYVHRIIYETFVGPIPDGYEIDHINTVKTDNRLENLRWVTPKENMNNPITMKHNSEAHKGNTSARGIPRSEFGRKFKDHYGITKYQNPKIYEREKQWYYNHNKVCSWEV